jgi:hypothetical protein
VTIADHHRVVGAKEKPVRSATSTPFNVAAKRICHLYGWLGLKKNADAVKGTEHRTNDYYDEEIHQSVPRCRWFRQLIVGVKSSRTCLLLHQIKGFFKEDRGFIDWLDDRRSFGFSVQELPQVRQQILIALLSPAVWICLQVGDKEFHEALIRVLFQDGNRV